MDSFDWTDFFLSNGDEEDQHWIDGEPIDDPALAPVPLMPSNTHQATWPGTSQATETIPQVEKRQKA
jgi:hypothetical protein